MVGPGSIFQSVGNDLAFVVNRGRGSEAIALGGGADQLIQVQHGAVLAEECHWLGLFEGAGLVERKVSVADYLIGGVDSERETLIALRRFATERTKVFHLDPSMQEGMDTTIIVGRVADDMVIRIDKGAVTRIAAESAKVSHGVKRAKGAGMIKKSVGTAADLAVGGLRVTCDKPSIIDRESGRVGAA